MAMYLVGLILQCCDTGHRGLTLGSIKVSNLYAIKYTTMAKLVDPAETPGVKQPPPNGTQFFCFCVRFR